MSRARAGAKEGLGEQPQHPACPQGRQHHRNVLLTHLLPDSRQRSWASFPCPHGADRTGSPQEGYAEGREGSLEVRLEAPDGWDEAARSPPNFQDCSIQCCMGGCRIRPQTHHGFCSSIRLPAIPGTPSRKDGKSAPKGKTGQAQTAGASRQRQGRGVGMFPPCEGENLTTKKIPRPPGTTELSFPVISVLSPASSEASVPEEPTYNVYRLQPPGDEAAKRLKNRPETFWTMLKEPQKNMLSTNGTKSTQPVSPMPRRTMSAQPKPPKTGSGLSVLWPQPP